MSLNINLNDLAYQFQGLQGRHPGLWPQLPRYSLLVGIIAAITLVGYLLYWTGLMETLDSERSRETTLRGEYSMKVAKAVNLDVLKSQKTEIEQYVGDIEKQLPSRSEMDALLSEINQAGVGRGAQLQLFRPGSVVVNEYYAELPIAVRLVGSYHDLGSFSSDIANLPRIVTLNGIQISKDIKTGSLVMNAVAKTFRYLDSDEIEAQRALKAKQQVRK